MEISREELCKLLRFRYAKTDPQMARVQLCHLHSMYEVCKGKEMYESKVEGVIKREMRKDLGDMRGGVEGLVNENF